MSAPSSGLKPTSSYHPEEQHQMPALNAKMWSWDPWLYGTVQRYAVCLLTVGLKDPEQAAQGYFISSALLGFEYLSAETRWQG
jgi:hypothetical protein